MSLNSEDEDLNIHQEFLKLFKEFVQKVLNWVKPNKKDNLILKIIKLIFKIPVVLLLTILSPIAFLILFFTFIILL